MVARVAAAAAAARPAQAAHRRPVHGAGASAAPALRLGSRRIEGRRGRRPAAPGGARRPPFIRSLPCRAAGGAPMCCGVRSGDATAQHTLLTTPTPPPPPNLGLLCPPHSRVSGARGGAPAQTPRPWRVAASPLARARSAAAIVRGAGCALNSAEITPHARAPADRLTAARSSTQQRCRTASTFPPPSEVRARRRGGCGLRAGAPLDRGAPAQAKSMSSRRSWRAWTGPRRRRP